MKKAIAFISLLFAAVVAQAQVTISNVYVSAKTATTATFQWTTNVPSTSMVRYGFDISLPFNNTADPALTTSHTSTLKVLTADRPYYFAVVSVDGSGNFTAQSTTEIFALCGNGDTGMVPAQGTVNNYYEYGTFTATWVPPVGSPGPPTICGNAMTQSVSGTLSGGATLSMSVADSYKAVPGPGTWNIIATDAGNLSPVSINFPVSSQSNDFSHQLQLGAAGAGPLTAVISNLTSHAVYPAYICTTFNGLCSGGGGSLSLTTNGSSGPATLISNVLNIPIYTGGGGGGIWDTFITPAGPTGIVDYFGSTPNLLGVVTNQTTDQSSVVGLPVGSTIADFRTAGTYGNRFSNCDSQNGNSFIGAPNMPFQIDQTFGCITDVSSVTATFSDRNPSAGLRNQIHYCEFPGYDLGNPNQIRGADSGWSGCGPTTISQIVYSQGINNLLNLTVFKYAAGDLNGLEFWVADDGGQTAGSDQGVTIFGVNGGQNQATWVETTIASTTGTGDTKPVIQALPWARGNHFTQGSPGGAFALRISNAASTDQALANINLISTAGYSAGGVTNIFLNISQGSGMVDSEGITLTSVAPTIAPYVLTSVATAVGTSTTYTGTITGGGGNAYAGRFFTVRGFITGPNNGYFVATASTATTLTLTNSAGVAETHAATAQDSQAQAVYTGTVTGGAADAFAGQQWTFGNFPSDGNNGTHTVVHSTSTTITVVSPDVVAENGNPSAGALHLWPVICSGGGGTGASGGVIIDGGQAHNNPQFDSITPGTGYTSNPVCTVTGNPTGTPAQFTGVLSAGGMEMTVTGDALTPSTGDCISTSYISKGVPDMTQKNSALTCVTQHGKAIVNGPFWFLSDPTPEMCIASSVTTPDVNNVQTMIASCHLPHTSQSQMFQGGTNGFVWFNADFAGDAATQPWPFSTFVFGSRDSTHFYYGLELTGGMGNNSLPLIGHQRESFTAPNNTAKIYCGAQVVSTTGFGVVPNLNVNACPWVAGDHITQVLNPTYTNVVLLADLQGNTPMNSNGGAQVDLFYRGNNFTSGEVVLNIINFNGYGMYAGCDVTSGTFGSGVQCKPVTTTQGWGFSPTAITINGPFNSYFRTPAPLQAVWIVDNLNPVRAYNLFETGGGVISVDPIGFTFGFSSNMHVAGNMQIDSSGFVNQNFTAFANITGQGYTLGSQPTQAGGEWQIAGETGGTHFMTFGMADPSSGLTGNQSNATLSAGQFAAGSMYVGAEGPNNQAVFQVGAPGSTTYCYVASGVTSQGLSIPSSPSCIATGNAVLDTNNANFAKFRAGPGTVTTNIYRTVGPGGAGQICTNVTNAAQGCFDTGQAAGAAPPTTDTSGLLTVAGVTHLLGTADLNGVALATTANVIPFGFTTTAALTDVLNVTGMTSSGHCAIFPTNAAAGTMVQNATPVFIDTFVTDHITVNHVATAGATFSGFCTPN